MNPWFTSVTHNIVAFYVNGNSSVVKFGSWDPAGIAPNAALSTFRTKDTTSWHLKANLFSMGTKDF